MDNFPETSLFVGADGVSADRIFHQAANATIPPPELRPVKEPEPTLEERLAKLEETQMPQNQRNSWEDPNYWNYNQQQAQQQPQQTQQQVYVPSQQEQQQMGKVPKPKDDDEMRIRSMMRQELVQGLTQIQQHQNELNQMAQTLRTRFLNHKDYAPWANVATNHFSSLLSGGMDKNAAWDQTVQHIQSLIQQQVQPPSGHVPSPNAGLGSNQGYGSDGQYRPDEAGMRNRIGFLTPEKRREEAERYSQAKKMDQIYRMTKGEGGALLKDTYHDPAEDIRNTFSPR